ncbi:Hypp9290 [Branchiostoma lanceolatum]|uniref:Hypp9290 protein n=1 Tax=Branchiostoma lanceolatum TaxID=7740 RepID=A0A8J9ZG05_BRALA|nr:Hypp9290 [Branchiostoma lanceolatum]
MPLLREQTGLLRSFVLGTVFVTVLAAISLLFYGSNKEEPRAIWETAVSQPPLGGSVSQAATFESPEKNHSVETPRHCAPRKNFIFIKTHKTGSSSVTNLLQRYALYHRLSLQADLRVGKDRIQQAEGVFIANPRVLPGLADFTPTWDVPQVKEQKVQRYRPPHEIQQNMDGVYVSSGHRLHNGDQGTDETSEVSS